MLQISSNLDYLAPWPPVTAGGRPVDGAASRRTSKTQMSNQRNFLLVCVADSILLLYTHIGLPVIQDAYVPPVSVDWFICLDFGMYWAEKKTENAKSSYDFG